MHNKAHSGNTPLWAFCLLRRVDRVTRSIGKIYFMRLSSDLTSPFLVISWYCSGAADWKAHLLEQGYVPITINCMLSALNGIF